MSLTIEVELKDVLNGINQKLDMIQKDVTDLKLGQVELKGDISTLDSKFTGQISTLDSKLTGQINTLDAKVDGLSTRVSNQELLLRTIVGGLILIILGGAARMFWNLPTN